MTEKEIIRCPICSTPVTIEGDDEEGTHYYKPIEPVRNGMTESQTIARLQFQRDYFERRLIDRIIDVEFISGSEAMKRLREECEVQMSKRFKYPFKDTDQ